MLTAMCITTTQELYLAAIRNEIFFFPEHKWNSVNWFMWLYVTVCMYRYKTV